MSQGFVQTYEVGSFVDGPGVRFVVFLSGCPLRCQYCHNPETWACRGEPTDSAAVLSRIARSAEFLKAGSGGVTVSGGEPLGQVEFTVDLLRGAQALGLHTALDTSGYLGARLGDEMLPAADLVLLDIKAWDPAVYRDLTGVKLAPTLAFAERLSQQCRPMWVRFVLVPGLTDGRENLEGLAAFVAGLSSVERVEVVPFHQMARHKWETLGLEYRLEETPEPTAAQLAEAKRVFEHAGLPLSESRPVPCVPTVALKE